MVVMHDPSGCNSTYNTHDETRWYEMDSQIFITGLTEVDAVMGNDRKLIDDVKDAAKRLHPEFIALCGSPIPFLNGTDFKALARIIERETKIPSFAVETNGMHDYVQGAGEALKKFAERFVERPGRLKTLPGESGQFTERSEKKAAATVNILGMTPLDYAYKDAAKSMRRALELEGFRVKSIWAMGDSPETLKTSGEASVNLVVSQVGLETARYLEKEFQIPYVAGVPIAPVRKQLAEALHQAEKDGKSRVLRRESTGKGKRVTVIGEPVMMGSLAAAITTRYGYDVQVISPMEKCEELLADGDLHLRSEAAIEHALKDKEYIVADPLYLPICPEGSRFYALPHAAFSGRCYLKRMTDLLQIFEGEDE